MAYSQQETKKYFLLSFVFLLCSSPWQLVSAQKRIIDNLPGFDGPLPFALETGEKSKGDPLLLWLSGGPGCSTISGLAFEIGPLGFDLENYEDGLPSLYYKSDSWTQVTSVIFVDSPVGTGFSYSRTTEGFQTSDTETVHRLLRFLYKWLEEHPKFKSNPLYITGSSYSGMIIPVLALEIAMAKESHGAQFNLKGYVAGNPLTNKGFERNYRTIFFHGMALISDELYESIKQSCSGDYVNPSNIHCSKYLDTVDEVTKDVYWDYILEPLCEFHSPRPGQIHSRTIGRSFYNEEVPLGSSNLPKECRPSLHLLSEFWANNSTVRDALGIRKGTIAEWHRCKLTLPYTNDFDNAVPYHRMMTNKGYPALIYSGDHDAMISYVSTQAWIRSLNFSIVDDWRPWYANGQVAGFTRRYSNSLTFATVKGAGHTAAEYKPKECLAMIASWLSGGPL